MTVLEAARANDIFIPTLCYAPKLRPVGACRLCIVEIEKMRGLPSACTVPVSDGMVVHTETEAVQNLRRETLSLILAEHPYTCLVCKDYCGIFHAGTIRKAAVTTGCQYCPANGQCELQDLVDYLKMEDIPYPISYRGLPVEKDDPFFDRDYNLCILCGRCIRACQEVRHNGVLAFINRGSQTIVGTAFDQSHLETDCQFCGACVDVCPTGALYDKRGKWEGKPDAVVPSVCPYCSVGCAVNVQVTNNHVARAVGHDDGLTNDGQLCVRGRFGVVDIVHNLSRLKSPLLRRDDRLVEVSWDEALAVVAEKLGQYQSDQFAAIGSATATNEDSYALQKFSRAVMHTNNVALAAGFPEFDHDGTLAIDILKSINGPAIRDVRDAACILLIGANLSESHPILSLEIRHALSKGASLITVDTRQTGLARQSEVWLQPKVGTDHVLLAGMIKVLANQGIISGNGSGPPQLGELDLNQVAAVTGVDQAKFAAAAQCLAGKAPTVIIYGSGVTHHPTAPKVVNAIRTLASLAGNTGVIGVPGEGNFVGAHDVGLHPTLLPGYQGIADVEVRSSFEEAWGVALNPDPGRSYEGIVDGIRQGQIKALYLAGEIPPMLELEELEFLVVQDIVSTDNIQYADVILPTTTFAEMDGSLTNLEGRVQRLRQAIPPVGFSQPGWMIIREVARRMGSDALNYPSAAEVMAEITKLVPAYEPVEFHTLDVAGVVRRFPTVEPQTMPLSLDGILQITNDEFPLTLITERNLLYYHGAGLTEQVSGMNLIKQEEILQLSSADASRLGVADGDLVKIVSSYGSTECIVQVTNGSIPEGTVFASFNRVNNSGLFPGLTPSAKAYAIRIELNGEA
jgi:predicted molibdopterin-dependent oxidoreductase YjgC